MAPHPNHGWQERSSSRFLRRLKLFLVVLLLFSLLQLSKSSKLILKLSSTKITNLLSGLNQHQLVSSRKQLSMKELSPLRFNQSKQLTLYLMSLLRLSVRLTLALEKSSDYSLLYRQTEQSFAVNCRNRTSSSLLL